MPTLFNRPDSLMRTLRSLDQGIPIKCVVVGPLKNAEFAPVPLEFVFIETLDDTGCRGAACAIKLGLDRISSTCEYISWLGDDDALVPDTLWRVRQRVLNSGADLYFGKCEYVDKHGSPLQVYEPSGFFRTHLKYWWNPIPQPGSWFRSEAYRATKGIDISLRYAFDQDLWHQMDSSKFEKIPLTLATYTFDAGTLSHDNSKSANLEAISVRLQYMNPTLRPIFRWIYKFALWSELFLKKLGV